MQHSLQLRGRKVVNMVVAGIDNNDHPDYVDAFIETAEYENGNKLTEDELDRLTEQNGEWINEQAIESMYGG